MGYDRISIGNCTHTKCIYMTGVFDEMATDCREVSGCVLNYMVKSILSVSQELLNHCFSDVERFMAQLQQAADAQRTLQQNMQRKKNDKKKKQGCKRGVRQRDWDI